MPTQVLPEPVNLEQFERAEKKAQFQNFELRLPESSYITSFVMVHWLLEAIRRDFHWMHICTFFFFVVLPEVCFLVASVLCQVLLTYYLEMELEKLDPCDVNVRPELQWIGALAFIGYMLQDTMQTVTILSWMIMADGVVKDIEGDDPEKLWKRDRIGGIVFIVLPKFAVAGYLSWVGTRFVMMSENDTELVLNCVAMTFVTQLDELFHTTASSQMARKVTKHLAPLIVEAEFATFIDSVVSPFMKSALWAGSVWLFIATLPQC